ncbi:MAG: HU family DNA-binding protein [bacterium]|nr:HU family DNA-binding protein [bacterium]
MTKRDLVVQIAEQVGLTQSQVKRVVEGVLDGITGALAEGGKVELRDFGIFKVKARKGRMGRNPRSGEEVPIEAKNVATFKPGKALKEAVK